MAHFAKIGLNNVVLEVVTLENIDTMSREGIEDENIGIQKLKELTGHETWKKCSFNTKEGVHKKGGIPFRKNYPAIGWTYNSERDAFIPPCPDERFILDEEKCVWVIPKPMPLNPPEGQMYFWDNDSFDWVLRDSI
jgi:hypothetical protein